MKTSAAEILNNLYGLMMDINYHRSDAEVLSVLKEKPDAFVEDQLMHVKRIMAKAKAAAYRHNMELALNQLRELKERGLEELRKILSAEEQTEYAKLFRKFEGLTPEDEASILEDKQLLKLLDRMHKNRGNDDRS